MMRLLGIAIPIVLLCATTAVSVHTLEDRELFVSPPDAVAEGFTRSLITRRYDQARSFFAEPDAMTNDELRARRRDLEQRLGQPDKVETEIVSRDAQRALVNVRLSSARGSEVFALSLVFDREWKVAGAQAWCDRGHS